jgi:hypothetical protein
MVCTGGFTLTAITERGERAFARRPACKVSSKAHALDADPRQIAGPGKRREGPTHKRRHGMKGKVLR